MDEVAEKTGITLKSCRRQYDNVKRVFKIVEDLPGSLTANIKQHFLLSEDLAKYSTTPDRHYYKIQFYETFHKVSL